MYNIIDINNQVNILNNKQIIKTQINKMSFQSVSIQSYFPAESMNHRSRCEQRWEDDANIYGDISSEWQISLKNGKRLNKHWAKCGGMTFIQDQHSGATRTIYNENYDVEWQKARYNQH